MRKKCVLRQGQSPDCLEKKINYPECSYRCNQGQKIKKELGGKTMVKKREACSTPGCFGQQLTKGYCQTCYQKKYREDKKTGTLSSGPIRPETPLLDDLEKDLNDALTDNKDPEIAEPDKAAIFPEGIKDTAIKSLENEAETGTLIKLRFDKYPEMLEKVKTLAKREFRSVPMQVFYIISKAFDEDVDALKNLRVSVKKS